MMKTYLEPEEIERLQAAATNPRDQLLIGLLFHLGCRISEALAMTVNDLDLVNKVVTIQHLKVRLRLSCPQCSARLGSSHTYCPRCGIKVEQAVAAAKEHRRMRTLPLQGQTFALLENYLTLGGPVTRDGQQFIFGINRHRAWQIIGECAAKAGLPELVNPETGKKHSISPHRLRDAFAVHAMKTDDSGEGMRLLQEHLGHASFNTTARYRKIATREHETWYQKLWQEKNPGSQPVPEK
jgi:integrase/recombinase XerD